jgi:hypothetical protein
LNRGLALGDLGVEVRTVCGGHGRGTRYVHSLRRCWDAPTHRHILGVLLRERRRRGSRNLILDIVLLLVLIQKSHAVR